MRVRQLMTRDPVCATPDMTVDTVARMMSACDCGAIPVVGDLEKRLPMGMVTDRDLVTRVIAMGKDPRGMTVRECMTSPADTVVEDTRIHDCVALLELSQIRRVIVVDSFGACCGILSQADIARHSSRREAGELLREISKPSAPALATS